MKPLYILLLLFCPLSMIYANGGKVAFIGNPSLAQKKASSEGKLYFIDFMANWCMPCKLMDETTFSNPDLANYVDNNYVAVKVNVEDFEGYAWKQKYNIKMLPTILVFDASGKVLGRYEQMLGATSLIKELQKYESYKADPTNEPLFPEQIPEEELVTAFDNPDLPETGTLEQEEVKETKESVPVRPMPKVDVRRGNGLFRFKVTRQPSEGFGVQVGVFSQYRNVLEEVGRLQTIVEESLIVHIDASSGRTVYKVIVGSFETKDEAELEQLKMEKNGVSGMIKDLSTLK